MGVLCPAVAELPIDCGACGYGDAIGVYRGTRPLRGPVEPIELDGDGLIVQPGGGKQAG